MGYRINAFNVNKEYTDLGQLVSQKNIKARALLQNNYGLENDCTLTCLASMFGEGNYPLIEKIAFLHHYDGEKRGTNPFCIKAIMKDVMRELSINGKCKASYVFWTYEKIKDLVARKRLAILNLWKDGRDYYSNHSVLVIGYVEYENHKFIVCYDCWSTMPSYIDYDKLSNISSINWYEE